MKREKKEHAFFTGIKTGLKGALAWAEGKDAPVKIREWEWPKPLVPMTPREIRVLRTKKA